ncbi:MAG: flagellin [Rhodospirillales bacterium]|nr:flagellin [Rhodospirillales bacterium]
MPFQKDWATSTPEILMSFSVNTNSNALAALETLNLTQQSLTKAQGRVSSGLKVAGAADDASTFAIAQGQRGDIAGFQQISGSLAIGSATVNVALQGAQSISDTLNSLKAKVVQGLSSSPGSLASIQNDIKSLISQIDSTASAAQFNGVNLINDAAAGTTTAANDAVLSSLNRTGSSLTAASITVSSQNLTSSNLGVSGINIANPAATLALGASYSAATGDTISFVSTPTGGAATTTTFEFVTDLTTSLTAAGNVAVVIGSTNGGTVANLTTALSKNSYSGAYDTTGNLIVTSGNGAVTTATSSNAAASTGITTSIGLTANTSGALNLVETAIKSVQTALSSLGTASNQLAAQTNFVKTLTDTLTNGVGQLVDADLAAESANLQALQTKQSLGIQALSIANQGPGAVLTLFR